MYKDIIRPKTEARTLESKDTLGLFLDYIIANPKMDFFLSFKQSNGEVGSQYFSLSEDLLHWAS